MANFYLVCGISGGGKTTLTERIVKKNQGLKIFDVDKYYEKINGDELIRDNTFDVWTSLYKDIHESEIKGENVILTTNSLTESQRTQFLEWFPTFNHHILWVMAPKDKCLLGNKQRRRNVPERILLEDWKKMEIPNPGESGWDTIALITNQWDGENYIIFDLKGDIRAILNI